MEDEFMLGAFSMAVVTVILTALVAIFAPPSKSKTFVSKSKAFVSKYCIEKQVKEACEILGEKYGK